MTPTNKLRFVERGEYKHWLTGRVAIVKPIRVLQQWWEPDYQGGAEHGEWRDVPLEVKDTK